jgi:hypothetical protein
MATAIAAVAAPLDPSLMWSLGVLPASYFALASLPKNLL